MTALSRAGRREMNRVFGDEEYPLDVHFIYFVSDDEHAVIKIGSALDPRNRLKTLQTGNPFLLRLIGFFKGSPLDELRIHDRFADLRIRGEWFRAAPELLAFIEESLHPGVVDASPAHDAGPHHH